MNRIPPPDELQRRASDPKASAWVAASAGTGKTKVLTDRALRLLLTGIEPSRLLMLTFTRAAAAEMGNRLARRLAEWASCDDATLTQLLTDLIEFAPDEGVMRKARRLFARVLDAPGGLAIETIHGFCQSLLRRFPLEARVPPHFQVIEPRDADELMHASREEMLASAHDERSAALAQALEIATAATGEDAFGALMTNLARERGRRARLELRYGSLAGAARGVRERLGLAEGESEASILEAACAELAFDLAGLRRAAAAMAEGRVTDQKRAAFMAPWLAGDALARAAAFDDWCKGFLTAKGEAFESPCTQAAEKARPGAGAILIAEAARIIAVNDRRKAARCADATAALLTLASAQLELYRRHKEARALLDYDDLILAALRLLRDTGAAWVHFKLDRGIDHVLIDEAQDTNPEQWEVVDRLTGDFFAGRGAQAEGEARTIFAVGDVKQSIFGFQGADPTEFTRARDRLARAVPESNNRWNEVKLETSFRSTPAVLQAVDAVFATPEAAPGVADDGGVTHVAAREKTGGLMELWPVVEPVPRQNPEAWLPPIARVAADDPQARLGLLVARRIRAMLDSERLESTGQPIGAGDILVLVRRRTRFVDALVRNLKTLAVPVAGSDRMVLSEQLAVMDLMALGNLLLLPEDDLTLATVLKGPLIGLSEDELFTLAWNRGEKHLWDALREHAHEPPFTAAWETLSGLLALADRTPPHDLFADVLNKGGKAKLLARLGAEAEDPIDEFMALTLGYERIHPPSLQGFLAWVESGGEEIKRDLDVATGTVRIMTVHGAKGLEAPVVILADTMQVPRHQGPMLFWHGPPGDELPIWAPRAEDLDPVGRTARDAKTEAERREYHRLLYVAMTRAADRLIVCGWKTRVAAPVGNWYELVRGGLEGIAEEIEDPFLAEQGQTAGTTVLRLVSLQEIPARAKATMRIESPTGPMPDSLRRPPEAEPEPSRPLAPSRPTGTEPPVRSPFGADDGKRYRRGRIIHKLFELLPSLPAKRRGAAMTKFLGRKSWGLDEPARDEIAAAVMRVLDDPAFAPLFGPTSRAEVPVAGLVGKRPVSGQIDRLVVESSRVTIVDFKTDRPAAADADQVPMLYRRQMAAYRALIGAIYPGRTVICALLWTDGPVLMPLPEPMLDEALSQLDPP